MRKLILCVVVMLAVCASRADAQELRIAPRVRANHSLSLDFTGLHYAYEHPLSRTSTIIGRAGVNFGGYWAGFLSDPYFVALYPSIEIEPRFYYGLDRRDRMRRSTAGNSASFLSLRMYSYLPFGYISSKDWDIVGAAVLAPTWGLRRVWGDGWMFEFHTGLYLAYSFDYRHIFINKVADKGFTWGPDLNFRFGWMF